jgi:hypothetical protein
MDDNQKEIWKKEASQIKRDLATRPKEVKKREVEIKVGNKSKNKISINKKKPNTLPSDEILRRRLGL